VVAERWRILLCGTAGGTPHDGSAYEQCKVEGLESARWRGVELQVQIWCHDFCCRLAVVSNVACLNDVLHPSSSLHTSNNIVKLSRKVFLPSAKRLNMSWVAGESDSRRLTVIAIMAPLEFISHDSSCWNQPGRTTTQAEP
jgi:hypothetical protein